MKLKMRILMLMGSLMLLAFAVNVGIASADHPGGTEWTCDTDQAGGGCPAGDRNLIGPAAENTLAPIGKNLLVGGADQPGGQGAINGFNFDFSGGGPDFDNPAVIGVTHNPLCPLHQVEVTP